MNQWSIGLLLFYQFSVRVIAIVLLKDNQTISSMILLKISAFLISSEYGTFYYVLRSGL